MQAAEFEVLIIGAGMSGIGMGCTLKAQCPDRSFAILERRQRLGGTWDLFRCTVRRSSSSQGLPGGGVDSTTAGLGGASPQTPAQTPAQPGRSRLPLAAAIALMAGLGLGVFLRSSGAAGHLPLLMRTVDVLGSMWVNAIRMTVLPLLVSLMLGAAAGAADRKQLGRLGLRAAGLCLLLLAGSALSVLALAPPFFDRIHLDPAATQALRATIAQGGVPQGDAGPFVFLLGLIPANIFKSAADGAVLPLLVFTVLFGAAAASAGEPLQSRVASAAGSVREVLLIVVRWVLDLAPLGVFAIGTTLGASLGAEVFDAVFYFTLVTSAGTVLTNLALYPVVVALAGISLRRFAVALLPAQVVAAGTRSSLAALPAMLTAARERLQLRPEVVDFVLPLCVSTLKLAVPLYWMASCLTVARLYGLPFGFEQKLIVAFASVFMSAAVPGIPNGGTLAMAPVFALIGLPAEGLAIAIALEAIPDIFFTVLNVTADVAVTTILGQRGSVGPERAQASVDSRRSAP